MKQVSMKKNFILSNIYQILTMILPLITAPYISRVLGPKGVGIYSFTNSIQAYFAMFAALGTVSYGTREISRHRNEEDTRSRLFWEIELLTVFTTLVVLIAWFGLILLRKNDRVYYLVLTFSILGTMFDISWFYMGIEQFKHIVAQNSVFKILCVIALFVFVKDSGDTVVYIAIMSLGIMLGNLSMWIYLPKYIKKVPVSSLKIWRHFKETLVYFIPTIATSIYTVLDKTLIGMITKDDLENGYYEQATKIINMAKSFSFAALNSVMFTRISFLFAENKIDEIKEKIRNSIDFILFMGIGICFGIIGVADNFVPLFFGAGYEKVSVLLKMMSPLVLIIGISNCLGSQYYTPAGLRKQSSVYLICGSAANLFFNLIFIPHFESEGAVVGSIFAELVITFLYFIHCNGYLKLADIGRCAWKKGIAGIVMLFVLKAAELLPVNAPFLLLFQIAAGMGVYVILLLTMKDSILIWFLKKLHLMR